MASTAPTRQMEAYLQSLPETQYVFTSVQTSGGFGRGGARASMDVQVVPKQSAHAQHLRHDQRHSRLRPAHPGRADQRERPESRWAAAAVSAAAARRASTCSWPVPIWLR